MVVAEFEAFFSRAIAPTRRVAIGELSLPSEGSADAAAMLLGGIVAGFGRKLDEDDLAELRRLINDVETGHRIPQPRLRHRFQRDRVGLRPSAHRLVQDRGGFFHLDLDHRNGTPEQHSLAAVYSARSLEPADRLAVMAALRRGLEWHGDLGPELLGHLRLGAPARRLGPAAGVADPTGWAIALLGLASLDGRPGDLEIRQAFRDALRSAHPDHGATSDGAAERIAELTAARRILLG